MKSVLFGICAFLFVFHLVIYSSLKNGNIKLLNSFCKPVTSIDIWYQNRHAVYKNRQKWLKEKCEKLNSNLTFNEAKFKTSKKFTEYFLLRKEKLMGCFIAKVASSSLVRTFIKLQDSKIGENTSIFQYIDNFKPKNQSEFEFAQKNFFKFMFVRNPMERLLSCYINKVENFNIFQIMKYSRERIKDSFKSKHNETEMPTFEDFLLYALTDLSGTNLCNFSNYVTLFFPQKGDGFAEHWVPFWKVCSPCHFKYDMIGKLETSQDDFAVNNQ